MTTVGHPPRLLHGHSTHEVRWVNKADGMSDSLPIASGLPHCGFCPRGAQQPGNVLSRVELELWPTG